MSLACAIIQEPVDNNNKHVVESGALSFPENTSVRGENAISDANTKAASRWYSSSESVITAIVPFLSHASVLVRSGSERVPSLERMEAGARNDWDIMEAFCIAACVVAKVMRPLNASM